jgi:hypothetical protein
MVLTWKNGQLVEVEVKNLTGNKCQVRYSERVAELRLAGEQTKKPNLNLQ